LNPSDPSYWDKASKTPVTLPPGSSTSAFFSMRSDLPQELLPRLRAAARIWIPNFFRGLKFFPGKYKLTVVCQYGDTPGVTPPSSWQTQVADIQEDISAPQSTVIFGAVLGGIFASYWFGEMLASPPLAFICGGFQPFF
jgi:hypothetical protein